MRDLFSRKDIAPITIGRTGFETPSVVGRDAGSMFLKLTPARS